MPAQNKSSLEIAVFGGGCFWCTEAVFSELRGVVSVMPGYAGGTMPDPTYEQVCNGDTGNAEVSKIEYDPGQISYNDLLTVFFATHDPTTLNRQGNDVGTQYRSIILYVTPEQKSRAEAFIEELNKEPSSATSSLKFRSASKAIVTELKPLDKFYPAEDYHHQYFKKNPDKAYCQLVISPKLEKLREKFQKLLKNKSN